MAIIYLAAVSRCLCAVETLELEAMRDAVHSFVQRAPGVGVASAERHR